MTFNQKYRPDDIVKHMYIDVSSHKDVSLLKDLIDSGHNVSYTRQPKKRVLKHSKHRLINWLYRTFNIREWRGVCKVKVSYHPIISEQ